jgi:hypothetical protein
LNVHSHTPFVEHQTIVIIIFVRPQGISHPQFPELAGVMSFVEEGIGEAGRPLVPNGSSVGKVLGFQLFLKELH